MPLHPQQKHRQSPKKVIGLPTCTLSYSPSGGHLNYGCCDRTMTKL